MQKSGNNSNTKNPAKSQRNSHSPTRAKKDHVYQNKSDARSKKDPHERKIPHLKQNGAPLESVAKDYRPKGHNGVNLPPSRAGSRKASRSRIAYSPPPHTIPPLRKPKPPPSPPKVVPVKEDKVIIGKPREINTEKYPYGGFTAFPYNKFNQAKIDTREASARGGANTAVEAAFGSAQDSRNVSGNFTAPQPQREDTMPNFSDIYPQRNYTVNPGNLNRPEENNFRRRSNTSDAQNRNYNTTAPLYGNSTVTGIDQDSRPVTAGKKTFSRSSSSRLGSTPQRNSVPENPARGLTTYAEYQNGLTEYNEYRHGISPNSFDRIYPGGRVAAVGTAATSMNSGNVSRRNSVTQGSITGKITGEPLIKPDYNQRRPGRGSSSEFDIPDSYEEMLGKNPTNANHHPIAGRPSRTFRVPSENQTSLRDTPWRAPVEEPIDRILRERNSMIMLDPLFREEDTSSGLRIEEIHDDEPVSPPRRDKRRSLEKSEQNALEFPRTTYQSSYPEANNKSPAGNKAILGNERQKSIGGISNGNFNQEQQQKMAMIPGNAYKNRVFSDNRNFPGQNSFNDKNVGGAPSGNPVLTGPLFTSGVYSGHLVGNYSFGKEITRDINSGRDIKANNNTKPIGPSVPTAHIILTMPPGQNSQSQTPKGMAPSSSPGQISKNSAPNNENVQG